MLLYMHAKKRLFFTKILLFWCKVIKKSEISILKLYFFTLSSISVVSFFAWFIMTICVNKIGDELFTAKKIWRPM